MGSEYRGEASDQDFRCRDMSVVRLLHRQLLLLPNLLVSLYFHPDHRSFFVKPYPVIGNTSLLYRTLSPTKNYSIFRWVTLSPARSICNSATVCNRPESGIYLSSAALVGFRLSSGVPRRTLSPFTVADLTSAASIGSNFLSEASRSIAARYIVLMKSYSDESFGDSLAGEMALLVSPTLVPPQTLDFIAKIANSFRRSHLQSSRSFCGSAMEHLPPLCILVDFSDPSNPQAVRRVFSQTRMRSLSPAQKASPVLFDASPISRHVPVSNTTDFWRQRDETLIKLGQTQIPLFLDHSEISWFWARV